MAAWNTLTLTRSRIVFFIASAAVVAASACAPQTRSLVPAGTTDPDKFLFDKGTEALNKKKWLTAREFFKQVTETYTQSAFRPDAKLGIGDTYLGEGTAEALVLAINEFKEFLTFYPTNPRSDYAQYKLGLAHYRQMRAPQRDQSETRETVKEFETFVERYPNSKLMPEVRAKLREAKDRLDESNYLVGFQGRPERGSGLHQTRRRLLPSGRIADQTEEGSRSPPLLREAPAGIRAERVPAGGAETGRRTESPGAKQVINRRPPCVRSGSEG